MNYLILLTDCCKNAFNYSDICIIAPRVYKNPYSYVGFHNRIAGQKQGKYKGNAMEHNGKAKEKQGTGKGQAREKRWKSNGKVREPQGEHKEQTREALET